MPTWHVVVELRGGGGEGFYAPFSTSTAARVHATELVEELTMGRSAFVDIDGDTHLRAAEIVAVYVERQEA